MLITRVTATPLAIPLREAYYYSQGVNHGINSILVQVETDAGLVGIGEACGDRCAEAILAIVRAAARLLEGADPSRIGAFLHRFYRGGKWDDVRRFANQALAGVETALWDLVGQAAGQPVHRLLGGAVRDHVNHFGFLQGDDPDALAREAGRYVAEGYDVLYMKVGRGQRRDLACVEAVRAAAGPQVRLRVDANMAWSAGEAIRELNQLARFDIEFAEQPVAWHDLTGLARVRCGVPMPVAVDQGCFWEADALEVVRTQAADVIVVGLHETGGITGMQSVAAIAGAAGLPLCRHGVTGETGVSTLTALQVLATIPRLARGNQVMHQLLEHDILADPIAMPGGNIRVPQAPGMGIRLDPAKVEQAARRYSDQGPYWPCEPGLG